MAENRIPQLPKVYESITFHRLRLASRKPHPKTLSSELLITFRQLELLVNAMPAKKEILEYAARQTAAAFYLLDLAVRQEEQTSKPNKKGTK